MQAGVEYVDLTEDLIMRDPVSFLDPPAVEKLKEEEMLAYVHDLQAQLPFIKKEQVTEYREIASSFRVDEHLEQISSSESRQETPLV
jgi:hypothetical protein